MTTMIVMNPIAVNLIVMNLVVVNQVRNIMMAVKTEVGWMHLCLVAIPVVDLIYLYLYAYSFDYFFTC